MIDLKGKAALTAVLLILAFIVGVSLYAGDSADFQNWLNMPLRDARIRDLAPLLFIAAVLAK